MKRLALFLVIALLSPAAAYAQGKGVIEGQPTPSSPAAPDPADPGSPAPSAPGGGGGGGGGGPATPPASAPAPITDLKVAEEWVGQKMNDDLFNTTINNETDVSQAGAWVIRSKLMYECVEVSIEGRKDDICNANPSFPECVGQANALKNATNCAEYFNPPTLGCKRLGTDEYSAGLWMAFADHNVRSMEACAMQKFNLDPKIAAMKNLTDMITFDPNNPVGASAGIVGTVGPKLSGISQGSTTDSSSLSVNANGWEDLAKRFDDGASHLGYSTGDIFRKTGQGQSFIDIVMNSPFAEELNEPSRVSIERALTNSKEIVLEAKALREATVDTYGKSLEPESSSPEASSGVVVVGAPSQSVISAPTQKQELAPLPPTEPAPAPRKTRLMEHERIAAIAEAARKRRTTGRSPASEEKAEEAQAAPLSPEQEKSLFQRIHLAYLKRHDSMKTLESATAREVQAMERPQFFRDL